VPLGTLVPDNGVLRRRRPGHLIGIVSRADGLSIFTRPDADIHQEVTEEVNAESILMDSRLVAATVHDGIVTLTEGVIAVRDQLAYPGTPR
jgi:hypothetical protein